ncbi:MAG: hypothetical protein V4735_05395 [Pseudomonadota bacterium]
MADTNSTHGENKPAAVAASRYSNAAIGHYIERFFTDSDSIGPLVHGNPQPADAWHASITGVVSRSPEWLQTLAIESHLSLFQASSTEEVAQRASGLTGLERAPTSPGVAIATHNEVIWSKNDRAIAEPMRLFTHEVSHRMDHLLAMASGQGSEFSERPSWNAAVQADMSQTTPRPGNSLHPYETRTIAEHLALYPDSSRHPREAFAEMSSHYLTMKIMHVPDTVIDARMREAYPHMWNVYQNEFIPAAEHVTNQLHARRAEATHHYLDAERQRVEASGGIFGSMQEAAAQENAGKYSIRTITAMTEGARETTARIRDPIGTTLHDAARADRLYELKAGGYEFHGHPDEVRTLAQHLAAQGIAVTNPTDTVISIRPEDATRFQALMPAEPIMQDLTIKQAATPVAMPPPPAPPAPSPVPPPAPAMAAGEAPAAPSPAPEVNAEKPPTPKEATAKNPAPVAPAGPTAPTDAAPVVQQPTTHGRLETKAARGVTAATGAVNAVAAVQAARNGDMDAATHHAGVVVTTGAMEAINHKETYEAAAKVVDKVGAKEIALLTKAAGGKVPLVGAVVATGFAIYEVGSESIALAKGESNWKKLASTTASSLVGIAGGLIGFGAGEGGQEVVHYATKFAFGEKDAARHSATVEVGALAINLATAPPKTTQASIDEQLARHLPALKEKGWASALGNKDAVLTLDELKASLQAKGIALENLHAGPGMISGKDITDALLAPTPVAAATKPGAPSGRG